MADDDKPAPYPLVQVKAAPDGTIMTNAAKYGRLATLAVFEMIGGTQEMAKWASENRGDFYTKLFPKVINKDVEVNTGSSVDELIRALNAKEGAVEEDIIDGEFETVPSLDDLESDEEEESYFDEDFHGE